MQWKVYESSAKDYELPQSSRSVHSIRDYRECLNLEIESIDLNECYRVTARSLPSDHYVNSIGRQQGN